MSESSSTSKTKVSHKNKKINSFFSSLTQSKSTNDVKALDKIPTTKTTTSYLNNNICIPTKQQKQQQQDLKQPSHFNDTNRIVKSFSNINIKQHNYDESKINCEKIKSKQKSDSNVPIKKSENAKKSNKDKEGMSNQQASSSNVSDSSNSNPDNCATHTNHKLRLPSFKKLRSKFSMKKSHSTTTTNLSDLNKDNNVEKSSHDIKTDTRSILIIDAPKNIKTKDDNIREAHDVINNVKSKMKNSKTLDKSIDRILSSDVDANTNETNKMSHSNSCQHLNELTCKFLPIQEDDEQIIIDPVIQVFCNDGDIHSTTKSAYLKDELGHETNSNDAPYSNEYSKKSNKSSCLLDSNGTSSSTLTANELALATPPQSDGQSPSEQRNSLKSQPKRVATAMTGILSSLSSSFSLSNGSDSVVKLRNTAASKTKKNKSDLQKRISLPATIVNGNSQILNGNSNTNTNSNTSHQRHQHDSHIYQNELNESDEYSDESNSKEYKTKYNEEQINQLNHSDNKSNELNGCVKRERNSYYFSNVPTSRGYNKFSKLAYQLPSYQSLSSMAGAIKISDSNMSSLSLLKPLNRNHRRASMSELGYGKIESYNKLDKLGEGTYATVYKGQSTINHSYVALKEIRLEHEEGAPCTAIREVSLLRQLKHANIVTLHDIIYTEKALTLVFEYLEKDLKQYMDDCSNIMSLKNVKLFLFQLLRGLAFCHARQILHRDLKPQNLLINQKGELKLADFGLARAKSIPTKTYSNEVVTLWYRPPDVLLGSTDYSTHIDMWGVGCIFFEMACGKPLFPGTKVEDELYLIFKTLGTPTEETMPGVSTNSEFLALNLPKFQVTPSTSLASIANRLDTDGLSLLGSYLRYNPKLRASASGSLRHAFFSTLPETVYKLQNNESIFDIPEITLAKDPGIKMNNTGIRNSSSTFYKF